VNGVKVRKVGNSHVITVPRELERYGLVDAAMVAFVPLRSGEILIVPAERMEEYIEQIGRRIVGRRARALDKLAARDRGDAPE
jgi:antitoxin component of MazEF toxin-antitoxin module